MQIVSDSEADSIDPDIASQRPLRSDIDRSSGLDLDPNPDHPDPVKGDDVENLQIVSPSKGVDDHDDDDDDVDCNGNAASTECLEEERAWYHSPRNWVKLNLLFFVVAVMVAALSQPELLCFGVEALLQWMERHLVMGSVVFMSLYIVCELLMFPCLLLLFGAGFVFCNVLHSMVRGLFVSTMIVFTAELVASTMAFLMARYLMRSNIKKMAAKYPKFQVIDAAVKRHGFRVTLLFRMSPLTPYNLFNYFMGLTSVRFLDYTKAAVGIFPNFFVLCFMGGSLHHIYQLSKIDLSSNMPLVVVTVISFVFVVLLVVYGTKLIRRDLAKISLEMKAQHQEDILSSENDAEQQPLTEYDLSLDIDSVSNI